MGVDLGSIYFELAEPIKTIGVYNQVKFDFKKKVSEYKTSYRQRRNNPVVRNYTLIKSSEWNYGRHIMVEVLDSADVDAFMNAHEIQYRERLEGTKGWAVQQKVSFKNSKHPQTRYFYVPYTIQKAELIEVSYLEPLIQNPQIDDLILGCSSKRLYHALREFQEKLKYDVVYCSDVHDIPRTSLAEAKKPNHVVNDYIKLSLHPVPEEVLNRMDSALQRTQETLASHTRNVTTLHLDTPELRVSTEAKQGEDVSVIQALEAIVAEIKRRKQTAIIDTSW